MKDPHNVDIAKIWANSNGHLWNQIVNFQQQNPQNVAQDQNDSTLHNSK